MSAFDRLSRMCGPQVPPELLAELAAHRAEVRTEGLSEPERAFLTFALGLAADVMASRGDEFTAEDEAALTSLRAMASPAAAPVPVKTAGDETGEALSPEREAEIRAARYTLRTTSPAAADIDIDDLLDELDRVRGELAQAIQHRDHWHAEVRCADARIAELTAELATAKDAAARHKENAYKQGELGARRLERARRAELQRDHLAAERDEHRAAAERAEAKLRKIEHGCETPESHNYGCPCETQQGGAR